ncbi:DUF6993 domain-containing protein [Agromyces indicus]|uniref:DUF6993 domain-containing protein n=1 Tax=Agromyces indicus TaxID=758919 RepID=A0ABU1FL36_9MICO|nr:hypothetical protein [Agromyces indicus]MDR5692077.1 hypothetical protein [Agromyces indicus]
MGRRKTGAVIVGLVCAAAFGLTGCTASEPAAVVTAEPTRTPRPVPSTIAPPENVDLVLRPELSAAENLTFFDTVNRAVISADPGAGGRAFIDALVAAGFDRAAMQVTDDTTTLGEPADSIQFAVGFGPDCLIGQYGPKSGGYQSAVRPALGTGGCLIGDTRPIDW